MKFKIKLMLPLAAFVFAANFGYAQTEKSNSTDSVSISTKPISEPYVYIGNRYTTGSMSKDTLLEQPFLTAKDLTGAAEWTVLFYRVTFVVNGKEEAPIDVTGSQFSDKVKSRIQSASSGTILEIANIKIQSTAGTRTIVRPIIIRIK